LTSPGKKTPSTAGCAASQAAMRAGRRALALDAQRERLEAAEEEPCVERREPGASAFGGT
jgi:hypothetical protein